MTDWTTCRVTPELQAELRLGAEQCAAHPDFPHDGIGFLVRAIPALLDAAAYEHMLGPLVPVLDADGQPVVRTVGDLTARHLGRLIDDGNPAYVVRLGSVGHSSTGTRYTGHVIRRDNGKVAGNVRCERVNPATPVEVLP